MNQTPTAEGLTEKQQDFYKTFGYVVLKQLFSAAELEAIRKEFDYMMAEQYSHNPVQRLRAPLDTDDGRGYALPR